MKILILLTLALSPVVAFASVENPKEHVRKMAIAQAASDYDELYRLYEQAAGKVRFSEIIDSNGGEEKFKKILEKYFTPYDKESIWVTDSFKEMIELKPGLKNLLSPYEVTKPGFTIVFVGDSNKQSNYFFKEVLNGWTMVQPEEYAPLPHG